MKLTPHPILLSLSSRLLQVTAAISPSAAKGASKGDGFLRASDRKVPAGKCRISKRGMKGELQRRNKKLYQSEGTADFRERVSRSIWPSKLGLSCDRILPARGILSFGGKVRLLLYVSAGWGGGLFSEKVPLSRCVFKRSICRGTFRPEQNQKTAKRLFEPIQRGDMGG